MHICIKIKLVLLVCLGLGVIASYIGINMGDAYVLIPIILVPILLLVIVGYIGSAVCPKCNKSLMGDTGADMNPYYKVIIGCKCPNCDNGSESRGHP